MHILVNELCEILSGCSLIKSICIVNYDETPAGKLEAKIRCRLIGEYQFQVWLHYEPNFQDYAYQLFSDQPLLRWDNAPHYPKIPTAPHHFHDEHNDVSDSPLSGDMPQDLQVVLSNIREWLETEAF